MAQMYDITPTMRPALQPWPGDSPLSREVLLELARGDAVTLSTMRCSVHLGAHADAPSHYGRDGRSIEHQPLDRYIGPCQLMHINAPRGVRIGVDHLTAPVTQPRLLLATGTFPDPEIWNDDFAALEPALVDHLHEQGVVLVGIDTPSVDLMSSKDLPAHARFLAHDMAILEGLVLRDVPAGVYELIALPLKLEGFDASPVRAVLRAGP